MISANNDQDTVLLVDAGNSRIKWSWLNEDGTRSEQQAAAYDFSQTTDNTEAALQHVANLFNDYTITKVVLVHVLGADFSQRLTALCQQQRCHLILINGAKATYGINLAYPNPAHLGADRLVGLAAARQLAAGRAAIIIDCGTAVTVDALNSMDRHLGGLIMPGLGLLSDTLVSRTRASHMDQALLEQPQIFTDNTAQAMGSGCLFALVGAIEGICQRMQYQMNEQPVMIICGGDARRIHAHLQGDFILCPDALMDGLQAIAEYG